MFKSRYINYILYKGLKKLKKRLYLKKLQPWTANNSKKNKSLCLKREVQGTWIMKAYLFNKHEKSKLNKIILL